MTGRVAPGLPTTQIDWLAIPAAAQTCLHGRFMSSRLIALVEHPAHEGREAAVEISTRRRITTGSEVE